MEGCEKEGQSEDEERQMNETEKEKVKSERKETFDWCVLWKTLSVWVVIQLWQVPKPESLELEDLKGWISMKTS
jgi:hypothetical protein